MGLEWHDSTCPACGQDITNPDMEHCDGEEMLCPLCEVALTVHIEGGEVWFEVVP